RRPRRRRCSGSRRPTRPGRGCRGRPRRCWRRSSAPSHGRGLEMKNALAGVALHDAVVAPDLLRHVGTETDMAGRTGLADHHCDGDAAALLDELIVLRLERGIDAADLGGALVTEPRELVVQLAALGVER